MDRSTATRLMDDIKALINSKYPGHQCDLRGRTGSTETRMTLSLKPLVTHVPPSASGNPAYTPAIAQTSGIIAWCQRHGIDPDLGFTSPSGGVHYLVDYNTRAKRTPVITQAGKNGRQYRWTEKGVLDLYKAQAGLRPFRISDLGSPSSPSSPSSVARTALPNYVVGSGIADSMTDEERELQEALMEDEADTGQAAVITPDRYSDQALF